MSMISELVDRLRVESKSMGKYGVDYMATLLMEASDTIVMLSEKARAGRPTGKWAYEKINSYSERIYCSECGSHAPFVYVSDDHYGRLAHGEIRKTNFCPNCGADMRGGDAE